MSPFSPSRVPTTHQLLEARGAKTSGGPQVGKVAGREARPQLLDRQVVSSREAWGLEACEGL